VLFTNAEERRFFCELFSTGSPRDAGFLFSSCDSFISKSFEFPTLLTEEKNDFRDFCTAIIGVLEDAAAELFPPPPDDCSMPFRSALVFLRRALSLSRALLLKVKNGCLSFPQEEEERNFEK
jgi:hypothetical protein